MSALTLHKPMEGCRVVTYHDRSLLFGQPPEVVKALLSAGLYKLDTLILPDVQERQAILLNNLEFPFYYFLFVSNGLAEGRLLNIVGNEADIERLFKLLRLTLLGESREVMETWTLEEEIKQDIYNASQFFAMKDDKGELREIDTFFNVYPFNNNLADLGAVCIERTATDCFRVTAGSDVVDVDLNNPDDIIPPYYVHSDLTPGILVKLGVDILGGASGFSPEEASTGMVLCFNGNYMLIDSIPFLDQHLFARGISKNQIRSLFLTHIHDDHCSMFPLMRMPHKVDVITTKEIFGMAMKKLSLGLGWEDSIIREHFNLVEIKPGQPLSYFGLSITAHYTVHSIPTIGATFEIEHADKRHRLCVVGDNQSASEIDEMRRLNLVRPSVAESIRQLYREKFDLLIADGGMGAIHGSPADALESQADRVVFVHVDELPEEFNATFSLAHSGKRYTVVAGDSDYYVTRCVEFLLSNFRQPLSARWLSALLANMRICHYNKDDVILKQGDATRNMVYMVLSGYCSVVYHDGKRFSTIATCEAGDFVGEMAVITGEYRRNASVRADTPVTVCEFSESTFARFTQDESLRDELLSIWSKRRYIERVPQFSNVGSTVVDILSHYSELIILPEAKQLNLAQDGDSWTLVVSGTLRCETSGQRLNQTGDEAGGFRPYAESGPTQLVCESEAVLLRFDVVNIQRLLADVPILNYELRKYRLRYANLDAVS